MSAVRKRGAPKRLREPRAVTASRARRVLYAVVEGESTERDYLEYLEERYAGDPRTFEIQVIWERDRALGFSSSWLPHIRPTGISGSGTSALRVRAGRRWTGERITRSSWPKRWSPIAPASVARRVKGTRTTARCSTETPRQMSGSC